MLQTLPREGPRPACRLQRLPKLHRHAIHAYHAVSPWSPDARHFAYTSVDALGRGHIAVHDLVADRGRILHADAAYDFHTGAGLRWARRGSALIGRVATGDPAQPGVVLIDLAGGHCDLPPVLQGLDVRHVVDADRIAIAAGPQADGCHAVFQVDLLALQRAPLLEARRVARDLPPHLALAVDSIAFDHPLLSAAGDLLFVKLMHQTAGSRRFHTCAVYDRSADRLHLHPPDISGHPVWHPRDPVIYNIRQTRDGADLRHIVAVDPRSGDFERVMDSPIEGPGHLDITPDGRWLITDAFSADGRTSPVYRIDLRTRACRELLRLEHRHSLGDYHAFERGQPHPAYAPDGSRFAINCNGGGDTMDVWIVEPPAPEALA